MLLKSELQEAEDGSANYNRITWTKNKDTSVTQLWELLDESGNVQQVLFKGIYKKAD